MTILEAIRSNPVFASVPDEAIGSALIGRSLDGAANYNEDSLKRVELTSADLYYDMATVEGFTEGQLNVDYNTNVLLNRAKAIYQKYNDNNVALFAPTKIEVGISKHDV